QGKGFTKMGNLDSRHNTCAQMLMGWQRGLSLDIGNINKQYT
ncbi:hypothetical protein PROFUN_16897, partial [Planoprotostelium fungivorum]